MKPDLCRFKMLYIAALFTVIVTIDGVSSTITTATDADPSQSCNSCCQGPSGLPGMSGPSGHNGLPGRDGFKGGKGEIGGPGLSGDKGPPGPEGQKGEEGNADSQGVRGLRGLPGKVGPQGSKGVEGQRGGKGEKGELGQKGESGAGSVERRRSAFTATKTRSQSGSSGDVLTFEETETNIGNHFDINNNRFTCQIPGVYWFTFTMAKVADDDHIIVYLVKNDNDVVIARFYERVSGQIYAQSTNGAVLQLAADDQVWIRIGSSCQVYSNGAKYTTFSGFLLYED